MCSMCNEKNSTRRRTAKIYVLTKFLLIRIFLVYVRAKIC